MGRRSNKGGSVSFFSFQDILIGTIGIVLMMTIILVLLIGSEFAKGASNLSAREEVVDTRMAACEAEVESLQLSISELKTRIAVDRTMRRLQLQEAILAANNQLKDSRGALVEKRTELSALADESTIDERALRALELMKVRDKLRESYMQTRLNMRVTYQIADAGDLEPIILEISRQGIVIASTEQFRAPPQTAGCGWRHACARADRLPQGSSRPGHQVPSVRHQALWHSSL